MTYLFTVFTAAYNRAHTRIQKLFGGVEPLIVVVTGKKVGALKEPESIDSMEAFQRYVDSDPDVGNSTSLADVIKSIALGARAVMIGRPVLWGLAVDGESGVAAVLELLRQEIDVAMALTGARNVSELTRDLVVTGNC